MKRLKELAGGVLIAGLVSTGVVVATPSQPAEAMVCGYSTELEEGEGGLPDWIPIIGGVSWSGKQQVAHWGNCTKSKQKIKITYSGSSKTVCVTPGDTRLGLTKNAPKVTSATLLGKC